MSKNKQHNASALNRDLIEIELMERYNWLPQDIAKIPYKRLQRYYIIKRQMAHAEEVKANVAAVTNGNSVNKR